jgi:hypothetical protein
LGGTIGNARLSNGGQEAIAKQRRTTPLLGIERKLRLGEPKSPVQLCGADQHCALNFGYDFGLIRGHVTQSKFLGSAFMNSSVKPDFSGEWILDRQASHLTGGASAMETGVLRIDHRDPKCGFRISMTAGGESVERAWESSLSDEIPVVGEGFYSRLYWDEDSLVFECGSKGTDATWSMLWRYELFGSGQRLRAVEQMRGHGGDFDNTWIFRKP